MKKNGAENITLPHSTSSMRRLKIKKLEQNETKREQGGAEGIIKSNSMKVKYKNSNKKR